jgi:glutamate--cysteine ligase catalytic subunit
MGWRVEMRLVYPIVGVESQLFLTFCDRSLDLQPSDFENAAFSVFLMILARLILAKRLLLYIPISKEGYVAVFRRMQLNVLKQIDDNMRKAHLRASIATKTKFAFPSSVDWDGDALTLHKTIQNRTVELFSVDDIICKKLVPLIHDFLDECGYDGDERKRINDYISFVERRSNSMH